MTPETDLGEQAKKFLLSKDCADISFLQGIQSPYITISGLMAMFADKVSSDRLNKIRKEVVRSRLELQRLKEQLYLCFIENENLVKANLDLEAEMDESNFATEDQNGKL